MTQSDESDLTTEPPESEHPEYPRVAIPALLIVTATYFASSGLSFPVLPRLVDQKLDGGNLEIGLAFSAFGVGLMVLRPFVGYLTDRFGRRNGVIAGLILVGAMQFTYVPAADIGLWPLLAARFVAGMGGSILYVGLATVATELPTATRRAAVFSIFASMTFVGFAIGPLLGDLIFEEYGFSTAYAFAGGLVVVATCIAFFIPDTTPADADPTLGAIRDLLHPVGFRLGVVNMSALLAFIAFNAFITPWSDELGVGVARWILFSFAAAALALRLGSRAILNHPNRKGLATLAYVSVIGSALAAAAAQGPTLLFVSALLLAGGLAFLTPLLILVAADSSPAAARARVVSTITFCNDLGSSLGVPILGLVADASGFRGMYASLAVLGALSIAFLRSPAVQQLGGFRPNPSP